VKAATLFSGFGGADVGLHEAGFDIVYANDIDPHACDTYELNHGRIDRRSVDDVKGTDVGEVDLLWASCPCQPWSLENNQRKGSLDPRNKFPAYLRLLGEVRPAATAWENVPVLARDPYFRLTVVRTMRSLGYGVHAKIVNAADLQVPQSRERLICIGLRGASDADAKRAFPRKIAPRIAVADVCPHVAYVEGYKRSKYIYQAAGLPLRTITASGTGYKARLVDSTLRKFAIEELLAFSTLPRDYKFPPGSSYAQMHRRIGNCVPAKMAFHIGRAIMAALNTSHS
jgi:DNA (cytosine-5)-methyltransferase 1